MADVNVELAAHVTARDLTVDPLSVHCPRCGVVAGDTCPPPRPCGSRVAYARVEARRAAERDVAEQRTARGLEACRDALLSAVGPPPRRLRGAR